MICRHEHLSLSCYHFIIYCDSEMNCARCGLILWKLQLTNEMKTKIFLVTVAFVYLDSVIGSCNFNQGIYLYSRSNSYNGYMCFYNNITNSVKLGKLDNLIALKISISSSNIVYFTSKTIKAENFIYYLKIENSSLSTIEKEAFLSYPDLVEIHFPQNNLTKLESGVFKDLNYLNVLNLRLNQIETIEDNAFESLERLNSLDLSENAIRLIATNFTKDLLTIKTANFSFNVIKTLEVDNFDNFFKLATLDLSHNLIDALPVGYFGHLNLLEHLNISHNSLKTLEVGTFVGLKNLKYLDLSHNQIATIPTIVFHNTPQLLSLDLSNNSITNVDPFKLYKFTKLSKININNNFFDCNTLSEIIEQLRSLSVEVEYGTTRKLTGIHGVICHSSQTLLDTVTANPQTQTVTTDNQRIFSDQLLKFSEVNSQLLKNVVREMELVIEKTNGNNSSELTQKYLELQSQAFKDAVKQIEKRIVSLNNMTSIQLQNYLLSNAQMNNNSISSDDLRKILNETILLLNADKKPEPQKTETTNATTILILICLFVIVILLTLIAFRKTKIFKDRNLFKRGSNTEEQIML